GLHQVTVSIGIAELRPGETVSSLIDRADQALNGARNAGRNRVHCATLDGGPNAIVMPDMSAAG
ncbi:MAG: diguanylate cyclase, partial [Gammaproteobacteria bacterium]|nr:diguanylate cyclase [Gammaproteobacteria bacterium]